jgi:hypothetical protein
LGFASIAIVEITFELCFELLEEFLFVHQFSLLRQMRLAVGLSPAGETKVFGLELFDLRALGNQPTAEVKVLLGGEFLWSVEGESLSMPAACVVHKSEISLLTNVLSPRFVLFIQRELAPRIFPCKDQLIWRTAAFWLNQSYFRTNRFSLFVIQPCTPKEYMPLAIITMSGAEGD